MIKPPQNIEVFVGDTFVGHLTHYQDGRNIFVIDSSYFNESPKNSTLSLSFTDTKLVHSSRASLPPFFSNLLPEGYLREFISHQLGIKASDEFGLLMALKEDLPGNIKLKPADHGASELFDRNVNHNETHKIPGDAITFSLAGVQIKFSMLAKDHQFTLRHHVLGDYIVKLPSVIHKNLPENEFSIMSLAKTVGINVPDIQLIKLSQLHGLPELNLPNEQLAYVIKRFDRSESRRVHIEDFAQVFGVFGEKKYSATNYETIARLLNSQSLSPKQDVSQFISMLAFNILIGNTDAHLKNFSLIYRDGIHPELAPAYDLITSLGLINNSELALNMARHKNFYTIDNAVIERFSRRAELSPQFVNNIINNVVERAHAYWPELLSELPLDAAQKEYLQVHWKNLQTPFRLLNVRS